MEQSKEKKQDVKASELFLLSPKPVYSEFWQHQDVPTPEFSLPKQKTGIRAGGAYPY